MDAIAFSSSFLRSNPSLRVNRPSQCPAFSHHATNRSASISMRTKREKKTRRDQPSDDEYRSNHNSSKPAPRISTTFSTLSLRQQLKIVQTASDNDSTTSKPVERTRFRRKKSGTLRGGNGRIGNDDVRIQDGKYSIREDPVLFIDGYNVVGAWPRLKKLRDGADLEGARILLLRDVEEFAHVRGWICELVFDAQGNTNAQTARKETTRQGVHVVYTGTETADSYIERAVFEQCEAGRRQVWAATSDAAQFKFSSAKGAHVMSSNLFIQELKKTKQEIKERLATLDESAARGKMLIANVDEQTKAKLYELRDKLDGRGWPPTEKG